MDQAAVIKYINDTFTGIESVEADGNTFFFYGANRQMPLATLVTKDDYDTVSNLNRPDVFRLNIGVSKATFVSLLGPPPAPPGPDGVIESDHDFTALDKIMPHPIYGNLFWVCVLNPGPATWPKVQDLLAEAYDRATRKA